MAKMKKVVLTNAERQARFRDKQRQREQGLADALIWIVESRGQNVVALRKVASLALQVSGYQGSPDSSNSSPGRP